MKETSIQRTLDVALQYFLYGSVCSPSLRVWLARKRFLSTEPLTKLASIFQTLRLSQSRWGPVPFGRIITKRAFAETLAQAYQLWEGMLPQWDVTLARIPLGQSYRGWYDGGGCKSAYHPVDVLRNLLERHDNLFLRAIVHGSIATLDDSPGFSDMDLAFVVRASVLKDPEKLLQLRKLAAEILTLTYSFDPFMHHGPYYISEIDLKWYPEAMFPLTLFGYGVDLINSSQELEVGTRASDDVTNQQLDMFEKYFANWPSNPFVLKDSYDLEWVLGSVMLLPALYLQRKTGVFHYKRDTFPLAEKDFSTEEWEPIQIASTLRASLSTRPKPSRPLVWLALFLRRPGLLQRWARRQPLSIQRAGKATTALGQDYPQRVLRLLRTMRSKLLESFDDTAFHLFSERSEQ